MRVALKIAYDGHAFYGHQRQPDVRTVEGECIAALMAAKVIRDVRSAFFRSASRTDRGVSAVGNVIAFDTPRLPDAAIGAFNDKARDVWAWAAAEVPAGFHPRHALERWYRYHLLDPGPLEGLREAGALFVGTHEFGSFTSEPTVGPFTIDQVDVSPVGGLTCIDVRARSFRRGMVRRIVAGMVAAAEGGEPLANLREALAGARRDFGSVPPEPLFLMDVRYDFPLQVSAKPKAIHEWLSLEADLVLRLRFLQDLRRAVGVQPGAPVALP